VEAFDGTRSVVITHSHPDHMDPDLIRKIVDRNQALVYANEEIVGKLKEKGVAATEFGSGTRRIGSFELKAIPAPHEAILSLTLPANTAYIVNDRLLHPGDSYSGELRKFRGLPLFALPITAPWTTEVGTAAFADDLAPKRILPIHDGYVKAFFLASRHQALGQHFEGRGIAYAPADEPGTALEI
jgi:L-ascorbate metabolism protein UlaG (beta-lactamase superfamily)